MRIGIDARIASTHRGMGRFLRYILEPLLALASDDEFYLYMGSDTPGWLPQRGNIHVRNIKGRQIPVYEQIYLPHAVAKDDPDVLWCPANTGPVRLRTPVVVTVHDVIFRHRGTLLPHSSSLYQRIGRAYTDWSATRLCSRAAHVITDSEFSAREIQDLLHVPQDRLSVISLGLTLAPTRSRPNETALISMGIDRPFFFFLGAIDPRKNTDFTVESFLDTAFAGETLLVVAGLGLPERAALRTKIASHPKANSIVLLEFVSDEQLTELYGSCLGFVFSSLYEGFGLPVLEAMHFGAPVLASNQSSVPEVGGDAILYFDPRSKEALMQGLSRLHGDSELRSRLSKSGKARSEQFSWRASAGKLIDTLRSAAK